jgi:PAS domain S-box-containing protein
MGYNQNRVGPRSARNVRYFAKEVEWAMLHSVLRPIMQNKATLQAWPYLAAIVAVSTATILGALLGKVFDTSVLFATYFAAVTFAAWYGGFGPGMFATALAYVAANWFFVPARNAFAFNFTSLAFVFVCVAIAIFSEAMKRAIRRARANAQQIVSLAESITDGFIVVDGQWRVTYMNRAAEEFNRRHRPTGSGQTPWDLFALNLGPAAQTKLRQAVADRVAVDFESYYEPWKRWFDIKASPADSGGLTIYFRDITERKRAEEEQRKLASIIETSEDSVIGMDLNARIVSWNAAAEKLYGYSAEEIISQPISILRPIDHRDEGPELLAKISRGESIRHYDTVRVAKDGRRIDVSLGVSPIKDAEGKVIGAAKIARDITDRKRAEEALREVDRRKDDFLALLGHELRNPLAGIVNGVQVLKHIGSTESEVVEIQAIIERQAVHMSRLIDDLLDVSRIARGKVTLRAQRLDLAALLWQTVEDHRPMLRENKLALSLENSSTPLWIDGDPVRLSQVLGNLLNNATKFTDQGGQILVKTRLDEEAKVAIVEVRDAGIGMSPDTMASLFEPFAQGETALGRSRGGLGLGLALVKGLVALHHGEIEAESGGPGQGSTFTIRLPLLSPPKPQPLEVETGNSEPECCRVLIIEDNPDVSLPMSKLLKVNGHSTAVATDGPSGMKMARQFNPDVVLCDIGLPGEIDGYGVAKALRADKATSSVYLVAVTGFGQEEDRRRAAEAGFDRHMIKPVDHAGLLALLTGVTEDRNQRNP